MFPKVTGRGFGLCRDWKVRSAISEEKKKKKLKGIRLGPYGRHRMCQ